MFRQIEIHPHQRHFQKILSKKGLNDPVQIFKLKTVTYGTTPACYLSTRVLKQLSLDERENFPKAADIVLHDVYLDGIIARIFDPLGLLGPVISKAKFFMQQLWLLKLEWHEKLPVHVAAECVSFVQSLPVLERLKLPRFVLPGNLESIILYGFSDASEKGFGAVIYVSVIKNNGDRHSQLLCSKSRVAPLKTLTIPRFFGRRGKSSKMFSDNGKTFVGANIELKMLHDLVKAPDETLVSYFNDELIDWNFIPPWSPNFGGLWESAVLNSRPLSSLSSDFETLSPGHFLIGRPVTAIVEPELINVKEIEKPDGKELIGFPSRYGKFGKEII
ncbi:uncharacterized protein TNCV_2185711 [Trichonephila clavipes]|nr:uncharacterized protein TNCV_2185711 [Trichonephila clavipes]